MKDIQHHKPPSTEMRNNSCPEDVKNLGYGEAGSRYHYYSGGRGYFIFLRASTLSSNASSTGEVVGEPSKVAVLGD